MNINNRVDDIFEEIVEIRRDFHKHPELGFKEHRTQAKIIEYLESWSIPYVKIAKTGVLAYIVGKSDKSKGNTVALRADIDALPVDEKINSDFKSVNSGIMHACGHDVHTTILLGTAKILKDLEESFSGHVKLFFQPAEETSGGALPMIEEGCLKNPNVDYVIGLHVMPYLESGHVELKYGKLNASSDTVNIKIQGKSGHGAYPEKSVDAILIASHVVIALQSLVSRDISPLNSMVLSLGKIEGGAKGNIISDEVSITGTLRTLDMDTRNYAKERIKNIVKNTAAAFKGSSEVVISEGYEPLINSDDVVDVFKNIAEESLDKEQVHFKEFPSLGVEDFSYFCNRTKGAFFHLGCGNKALGIDAPLHSPMFTIDESCIKTGILLQVKNTLALLNK